MSSASGQPQFRYTQPPSKVIHLRNLPWECTAEELIELGKPFGKVVNTKCNVGANQNQAFIEFADLNQAIAMISCYASSAEPAQVRGKTVYLQYSNRQEIVNSKTAGETASNVLLVTMEGVEPGAVSIDVLHLVFSAFGFVHKIATFEKAAGYQALIQFSDSETASSAKTALDGRCIPSYLLPELDGACTLKINFSAHTVLNVKFQSHRSRDYTNPYLPVAPSAIDGTGLVILFPFMRLYAADLLFHMFMWSSYEQDGKKLEPESNVLLASIENMQYAVTIDVLHQIFSAFGFVQKIAIFEKNSGFQALIQYPDIQTAVAAKESLEGHNIYEGGFCKLHLTYSRHTDLNVKINNERGRDYTGGNVAPVNNQPSILGPQPTPLPGAFAPPYSSSSAATTPATAPGTAPILATPGAPPADLPAQSSGQPYPQPAAVPPGVPPQYPSQGILQHPPGAPQTQAAQHLGQGSQQMPSHVNHQFPPGVQPQFMQYPGNGSQPMPGPQAMQFTGHGGQHLPPGSQMLPPPGYGSQPFPQGLRQPMPQFPVYSNQQFPPGPRQQMMPFDGHGNQQFPFAPPPHRYN